MLLNFYLYQIHSETVDVSFYYLDLYCHCIRHNNLYKEGGSYVIKYESNGHELKLVMDCKKFTKIIYSLFAISHSLIYNKSNIKIPRQIISRFSMKFNLSIQ